MWVVGILVLFFTWSNSIYKLFIHHYLNVYQSWKLFECRWICWNISKIFLWICDHISPGPWYRKGSCDYSSFHFSPQTHNGMIQAGSLSGGRKWIISVYTYSCYSRFNMSKCNQNSTYLKTVRKWPNLNVTTTLDIVFKPGHVIYYIIKYESREEMGDVQTCLFCIVDIEDGWVYNNHSYS